jgi:viroplasmin and RNaseH domain-containing protein
LPPPNLRDATLRPVKSRRHYKHAGYPTATYKHAGYPTATYKSRAAAKVYMPIDHSASMPTFSRSRPSSGVSAAPSRLSSPSRVSRSKD